ncbi:MAG: LacI family DNA-binding transcriptional regulator [Propionibacteriaceae bacterium]
MTADTPATLATVAASAGVSVATVSKVLNGRADVGPATRERVQTLLAQHQYVERRSESARRATVAEPTVELVFHGRPNGYWTELLQGVLRAAADAGVAVCISARPRHHRGAGVEGTASWVRRLAAVGRRAVIDVVDDAHQGDLAGLSRARLPLVVIDPLNLPRRQLVSVGATNSAGGVAATEHLLGLGHRRIAYMGAEATSAFNQARLHGYRAVLESAGIQTRADYVQMVGAHYEDGTAGGAALLDLAEPPTAVFAATDELAAGVIEAARVRNLRVPQDLSVVGFDDTEVARLLSPPLTTVRQPLREMGAVALRTALRLADGDELDSHHVELATELVIRSSTARLRSR